MNDPVINTAPFPTMLQNLVSRLKYREWRFDLVEHDGSLCIDVLTKGIDSYNPDDDNYRVHHYMQVPPASYNEQSWRRWLFNQILLIERHEACEFFKIDGKRPYAPHHGPGNDPYTVFERGTDVEARTMYTGEVRK